MLRGMKTVEFGVASCGDAVVASGEATGVASNENDVVIRFLHE